VQSLAISDRGLVLVAGQVALEAPTSDLLNDPRLSGMYHGGTPELTDAATSPGAERDPVCAPMTSSTRTKEGT
jgi:hypothetical protein